MGTWDLYPIAVNIQMLLEVLNWIGDFVYGAPNGTVLTLGMRTLAATGFTAGSITVATIVLTGKGQEKLGPFIRHVVISTFVITVFFTLPVKLRVHDIIMEEAYGNPNLAWTSGNVPLGLGLPLYLITEFEFLLTRYIDDTLTENFVPVGVQSEYLKLSRGGGVGALGNIMLGLHSATAQDPRLVVNTMTFINKCVTPAVALKVIPPAALANADNLLAVISANLLTNFFADYENAAGVTTTFNCVDYYNNRLLADITAAQPNLQSSFVRAGFNAHRTAPGGVDILNGLLLASESTMRSGFDNGALSGNATILNAWVGRMIDLSVSSTIGTGDPLIQAMSEQVREFKAESAAKGIMALTWLPKIKGGLTCLLCALWLPLIPFMLYYGNRILISWSGMLLWLSLWGIMLTIINANYTHELVNALTNSAPTTAGTTGLTFGNRYAIWTAASESLAGMGLMVSWVIPLSGILVGWISTHGFGAAGGATQVAEQAVDRSTRGVGGVVSTEGAANMFERNYEARAVTQNPEILANAARYNTAQKLGRADVLPQYGPGNVRRNAFVGWAVEAAGNLLNNPDSPAWSKQAVEFGIRSGTEHVGWEPETYASFQSQISGVDIGGKISRDYKTMENHAVQAELGSESGVQLSAQRRFEKRLGMDIQTANRFAKEHGYSDLQQIGADEFERFTEDLKNTISEGFKSIAQTGESGDRTVSKGIDANLSAGIPGWSPVSGGVKIGGKADHNANNKASEQDTSEKATQTSDATGNTKGINSLEGVRKEARENTKNTATANTVADAKEAYAALGDYNSSIRRSENLKRQLQRSESESEGGSLATSLDVISLMAGEFLRSTGWDKSVASSPRNAAEAGKEFRAIVQNDQEKRALMIQTLKNQYPQLSEVAAGKEHYNEDVSKLGYQEASATVDAIMDNPALSKAFREGDVLENFTKFQNAVKNIGDNLYSNLSSGEKNIHDQVNAALENGRMDMDTLNQIINNRSSGISETTAKNQAMAAALMHTYRLRSQTMSGVDVEDYKNKDLTSAMGAIGTLWQSLKDVGETALHPLDDASLLLMGIDANEAMKADVMSIFGSGERPSSDGHQFRLIQGTENTLHRIKDAMPDLCGNIEKHGNSGKYSMQIRQAQNQLEQLGAVAGMAALTGLGTNDSINQMHTALTEIKSALNGMGKTDVNQVIKFSGDLYSKDFTGFESVLRHEGTRVYVEDPHQSLTEVDNR